MSTRPLGRVALFAVLSLMLGLVFVAPVSAGAAAPVELIADLSGANEAPGPGDPDGLGSAFLVIDPENGAVCPVFIDFVDIGEPMAAHIHEGAAGVAGPIVVDLFAAPVEEGFIENCVEDVDTTLLDAIVLNPANYYVNVHTSEFPAGAIRGQLGPIPPPPDCTPPNLCGSFVDGPGTAPPGSYLFGGFASPFSLSLQEAWISFVLPDGFILLPPDLPGEIFVGRVEGTVFTGPCGASAATIPISAQSYVDFLEAHPNVSVTSGPQPATLGGASGFLLDVVGAGTAACPFGVARLTQSGVEEGLPPEAGQYVIADGERIRIWLVDAGSETIFLAVSNLGQTDFDTLFGRAQPVISSMVFSLANRVPTTPQPPIECPGAFGSGLITRYVTTLNMPADSDDWWVSVEFTLADEGGGAAADCQLTLATYELPGPSFSFPQTLHQAQSGTFGAGTHTLTAELPVPGELPDCFSQFDFVFGPAIDELVVEDRYGDRQIRSRIVPDSAAQCPVIEVVPEEQPPREDTQGGNPAPAATPRGQVAGSLPNTGSSAAGTSGLALIGSVLLASSLGAMALRRRQ